MNSLPEAYARVSSGDLSSCDPPWIESGSEPGSDLEAGDAKRLWQAAIDAEAMVQRGSFDAEGDASRKALFLTAPSAGAALACARLGESLMRSDVLRLSTDSWPALSAQLTRLAHIDERAACVAALAQGWCWWMDPHSEAPDLDAALIRARQLGISGVLIEFEALRALSSLFRQDHQAAVQFARRASRMARAEEIPHLEILTNFVLARVRRLQGHTHLAIHILRGLQPHTPPPWREWLNWELCMSGSPPEPMQEGASHRLAQVMHAVRDGAALEVTQGENIVDAATPSAFREDATLALALLIPETSEPGAFRPSHTSTSLEELRRWRCGDTDHLPPGLSGIAFMTTGHDFAQAQCAFVHVGPGRPQRVAAATLRFMAAASGIRPKAEHASIKPRADSGLALLALSEGTIPRGEYFRRLYGFEYEQGPHGALFGMHRKRMRARLGDAGTLEFDKSGLTLRIFGEALLPDPRAGEELGHRALRAVSSMGGMSARDLARALQVPLRSAQRTLAELTGEGALRSRGEGPQVRYEVEDTTFSEPTQSRLFPSASLLQKP